MDFRVAARASRRVAGLLLIVCASAAWPFAAFGAEVLQSAQILYFEPLRLSVPGSSNGQSKSAGELHQLQLAAYGREYALSVNANETFHASLSQKPSRSSLKLYRGAIDGIAGSWVRLATKGTQVHGMVWDGVNLLVIAPTDQVRDQLVPPLDASAPSVVFRLSDVLLNTQAMSCATDAVPQSQRADAAYNDLLKEMPGSALEKLVATKRLELSALGDARFLARYASEQDARDAILLRLNNVDGIFSSQLGIQIQVPTVRVHNADTDPLTATQKNATTLLEDLADLRRRTPELRNRGLTHLFTGRDLDGTTVGIAYMDSLCDKKHGVGLTENRERGSWYDSLVTAHEIGHNFGAYHDGDSKKACASTPTGLYLMSANVNGSETFSQCSLQSMRPKIAAASCIAALPPANVSVVADLGTLRRPISTSFDWDVSVTNAGGAGAIDVRTEILVAPAVNVEDVFVTGGSCTSGAGVIQCHLGDLAGGTSRAVHLKLSSATLGSSSISARVFAHSEASTNDNEGMGTIMIEPEADVSIALEGPAQARAGDWFDVRFTIANAAVIDATDLRTTIALPSGFSASNPTQVGGSCVVESAAVTCTLPTLASGTSAGGLLSLHGSQAGLTALRAEISGGYLDPDSSNDAAELAVQIMAADVSSAVQSTSAQSQQSGGGGGGGSSAMSWLLALALLTLLRHGAGVSLVRGHMR